MLLFKIYFINIFFLYLHRNSYRFLSQVDNRIIDVIKARHNDLEVYKRVATRRFRANNDTNQQISRGTSRANSWLAGVHSSFRAT